MKKILFIAICLLLLSCNKELLNIHQINSNYPIILKKADHNACIFIEFPIVFEIKKSSLFKRIILLSSYNYYAHYIVIDNRKLLPNWIGNIIVYMPNKGVLKAWNASYSIFIGNIKQEYVFYPAHYYYPNDTNQILQKYFKPYMDKMKASGKDTLHIGSIQELKKTNPELLNTFLKGDSIKLTFYYDKLYHNIKLPVEIK